MFFVPVVSHLLITLVFCHSVGIDVFVSQCKAFYFFRHRAFYFSLTSETLRRGNTNHERRASIIWSFLCFRLWLTSFESAFICCSGAVLLLSATRFKLSEMLRSFFFGHLIKEWLKNIRKYSPFLCLNWFTIGRVRCYIKTCGVQTGSM